MHQLHITPDFHSDKCTMFAQKLKTTWKKQQQKPIILCDNIRNMTKILAGQMTEYDTTGHLELSLQPITCTGTTFTDDKNQKT